MEAFLLIWEGYMSINVRHSCLAIVRSDKRQGSVLGPVLFLTFIDDVINNLNGQVKLFANDCVFFTEICKASNLLSLNGCLGKSRRLVHQMTSKIKLGQKCVCIDFKIKLAVSMYFRQQASFASK